MLILELGTHESRVVVVQVGLSAPVRREFSFEFSGFPTFVKSTPRS